MSIFDESDQELGRKFWLPTTGLPEGDILLYKGVLHTRMGSTPVSKLFVLTPTALYCLSVSPI
jgi:hypothetical protein